MCVYTLYLFLHRVTLCPQHLLKILFKTAFFFLHKNVVDHQTFKFVLLNLFHSFLEVMTSSVNAQNSDSRATLCVTDLQILSAFIH